MFARTLVLVGAGWAVVACASPSGSARGVGGETWNPATDRYERLLGCYAEVMESKGLHHESPRSELERYDELARQRCVSQIRTYRRIFGQQKFEEAWAGLWDEYWSRL